MATSALISGLMGQVSSYLVDLLLDRGSEVHGKVCRVSTRMPSADLELLRA